MGTVGFFYTRALQESFEKETRIAIKMIYRFISTYHQPWYGICLGFIEELFGQNKYKAAARGAQHLCSKCDVIDSQSASRERR